MVGAVFSVAREQILARPAVLFDQLLAASGADKEAVFLSTHDARSLETMLQLPEWNDTMCMPTVRILVSVSMLAWVDCILPITRLDAVVKVP